MVLVQPISIMYDKISHSLTLPLPLPLSRLVLSLPLFHPPSASPEIVAVELPVLNIYCEPHPRQTPSLAPASPENHAATTFVPSLRQHKSIVILVKVGAPINQTITALFDHLEPNDTIIDSSNEW